jgi:hypothetical protein
MQPRTRGTRQTYSGNLASPKQVARPMGERGAAKREAAVKSAAEVHMADVELTTDNLIIHIRGIDKVLAFASKFEVPKGHVKGARKGIDEEAMDQLDKSIRLPGAYMPGLAIAGRFYEHGKWMFWDIHKGTNALTIDVDHEKYNKLVVEVEDPVGTVDRIAAWLKV